MPPITADDILKSVHDLKGTMQDEIKTVNERVAEAKKQADDVMASLTAFRRDFVNPGGPLTQMQGAAATQRGGLFDGQMKLPYMRMITMSAGNPVVLPRDKERVTTFQQLHDALVIRYWAKANELGDHASKEDILRDISKSVDWQMWVAQMEDAGYARANEVINPGAAPGSNLDFTILSNQMIDLVRIEAIVASQFPEVTLPRAKTDYPAHRSDAKSILGGGLTTYAVPATTNTAAGMPQATMIIQPTTGQITFSCIHNLGAIPYNDDMLEDSVVPFLPYVYQIGVYALARGRDAAIVNGDKTATHMDTGETVAAYDIRRAWYGLRYVGSNNTANIAAAATSVDVNTLMQKLGKYATNPRNLRVLLNVIDWLKICADPLISKATVGIDRQLLEQGIVDTLYGVPVVLTEEIRRDLNASGIYDNSVTDNTIEILVRSDRFWRGQTRGVRIEQVRAPQALAGWLQLDSREDFVPLDLNKTDADHKFDAGVAPVAIGINVTV